MRTTSIRFTGLASGLDTESIVQSMVLPYKMKMDGGKQNQTMLEWKKDAWRDMNKSLFSFYDQQIGKLRLESTYNKKNVSISNTTKIELRPNSTLSEGTHTIDYIKKLAESAKLSTSKVQGANQTALTQTSKVSEIVGADGKTPLLAAGEKVTIKVSDAVDTQGNPIYRSVELSGDMTIGQMQVTLNAAMPNTSISFDDSASAFFITGKKTGSAQFIKIVADDPAVQEIAKNLLGIKVGQGTTGTEMIAGQITYQATSKAVAGTKLSALGITSAQLADGDQFEVTLNGEKISITLTEELTLAGIAEQVNEAIAKLPEPQNTTKFAYDTSTGKFKATTKDGEALTEFKLEVTNGTDVNTNIQTQLDAEEGFVTTAPKVADGNVLVTAIGLVAGETLKIKAGEDTFEVTLTADMTLKQLTEQMQQKLGTQGTFTFDEKEGKLVMSQGLEVLGTDKQMAALNLRKNENVLSVHGVDAIVSYNGVEVVSDSNNISVNGFNFTIKSTTALVGEAITVVSAFDADAVVDSVKSFIEAYNKLIEDSYAKLEAPSAAGYQPLTDEQKKEMSDYEVEQWEKKIKDSLFRNDPDLRKAVTDIRQVLESVVEGGTFGALSDIGITTGNWNENGKLYFDEDEFRKALSDDADGVIQMLAGSGDPARLYLDQNPDKTLVDYNKLGEEAKASWVYRTKGIMDRVYDHITQATKSSELKSTYSFYNDKAHNKKIQDQMKEVTVLQERMLRMEDMYYRKFTAMEKMMSQLNNQSNWLMSQLGGMQ